MKIESVKKLFFINCLVLISIELEQWVNGSHVRLKTKHKTCRWNSQVTSKYKKLIVIWRFTNKIYRKYFQGKEKKIVINDKCISGKKRGLKTQITK